ncbi:M12 family metallopeptidase [Pararhodobacter sp.]|uniref:M12 family metallopeptidase n=1 Tax=Pararhodobacter sp. TaxID=2127056 RepID=UPI003A4C77C2
MIFRIALLAVLYFSLSLEAIAQDEQIELIDRGIIEEDGQLYQVIDDMYLPYERVGERSVRPLPVNSWPNGVIPISFESNYPDALRQVFFDACSWWSNVSRVRCVRRTTEADYIYVVSDNGNSSVVGRVGGRQTLRLFNRNHRGIIAHELAHALGFHHQQNSPERNLYVRVLFQNIRAGAEHNFQLVPNARVFGFYDYCSIMHYGLRDFSKNGEPTIEILRSPSIPCVPGQRTEITMADAMGMAAEYGRDPNDRLFVPVPDLSEYGGRGIRDSDWAYSRFGLRTRIVSGQHRDECRRITNCESVCYTTMLSSQNPQPATVAEFGTTVQLVTYVHTEYIFNPPPNTQCQ